MPFRIGYLSHLPHPAFAEAVAADAALELVRIGLDQPEAAIRAALAECHGYYTMASRDELPKPWHVTPALLAALPRLLLVSSYGAGYDPVDRGACTASGVALSCQSGGNAEGVAEHALGLILLLLKRVPQGHAAMRAGEAGNRERFMGREVVGRTVGLVGLGHIGRRVAAMLRALGARVVACDPYVDAAGCAAAGAEKLELPELLAASDVVSLHCPLDASTRGLFGAANFAAMRPGAIFVSTARGGIHDEAALLAALGSGHLDGAGLDVWDREPPDPANGLLHHPAVLASPHNAGVTGESRERVARMAAESFSAAARGELPPRLQNPEVAGRWRERWAEILG